MNPSDKTTAAHLTQADLDRVASHEEAESLPLLCHQEDCFVHGSELGVLPTQETAILGNPSNTLKK